MADVRARVGRALVWLAALCACAPPARAAAQSEDGVGRLVAAVEQAVRAGDETRLRSLVAARIAQGGFDFLAEVAAPPRVAEATVKARDRAPLADGGVRLLLEILVVRNAEARVSSWRVDVAPDRAGSGWVIVDATRLTVVDGLFRLALDASTEYAVHDLVVRATDLTLTVHSGYAFLARTPAGPTAAVIVGRGRMELAPAPESERGQMRLFAGSDVFASDFGALFLRVNPGDFQRRVSDTALAPRGADPRHLRQASQVFDAYEPKSFEIDLNDLSAERWSMLPTGDDVVAEIVTTKHGPLTYARASGEPEDVSFFDRRRRRNIAVYASAEKVAARGRFFSDDDRADYLIARYNLDIAFAPERSWIDGVARLSVRTRAAVSTLTMRLADSLVLRNVTSPQFGRLLHLRVVGQHNVLIGFPGIVPPGTDVDLVVTYGGRLPPQALDREAVAIEPDSGQQQQSEEVVVPMEPQYLYSNRTYWYPQAPVNGYALATMTLSVPGEYAVVASGTPDGPPEVLPPLPGQRGRKRFVFRTSRPARYLSCVISRFETGPAQSLELLDASASLPLTIESNPHQAAHRKAMFDKAADILRFYSTTMADAPYESFTLALTESDVPGGHSPAYFAVLDQPLPTARTAWTGDPVAFQNYPSFFVAHEIAHQWWGQAVGWKNYHEQWLSEGFAQYFAALYAARERGADVFGAVLRQMRRTAIEMSPEGPVYLGYRLGHLKGDSRIYRALVYNKGAMVLHMLRRLVGDEAFFSGLRDFYRTWRYRKAGTDDFRIAMEQASGRPLERFFDRWIYGTGIPQLRFTNAVEGTGVRLRFEQTGEVFDVPVTVSLAYADGSVQDVVVPVTDRTFERTIPLKGALRGVDVNKDGGALARIQR